jgi:hypothetical protein
VTITPSAPAFLKLAFASDDEARSIEDMLNRLRAVNVANAEAESRYEGSWCAKQFGISIPPNMRGLHTPAGWDGTVVDVLEERLDWLGWTSDGDDFDLAEVYSANGLDVDGGMAHLDALIFGLSFVSIGSGFDGEPNPLITPHSPTTMTAVWDRRTRRLSSALATVSENGDVVEATLYTLGSTATFARQSGRWHAVDRDAHNMPRLPVVAVPNRVRGSRDLGRSEITKPIRYYSDAASRTLLGLEVNREFYNAPQRIGLNVRRLDVRGRVRQRGQPVDLDHGPRLEHPAQRGRHGSAGREAVQPRLARAVPRSGAGLRQAGRLRGRHPDHVLRHRDREPGQRRRDPGC